MQTNKKENSLQNFVACFTLIFIFVPKNVSELHPNAKLVVMEDNEAVIKMIIKGRSPTLRHVSRTHRVDLDWLFERITDV